MKMRTTAWHYMLAGLLGTLPGCSLGYNDARSVSFQNREEIEKYQQFKAQRYATRTQVADEQHIRDQLASFAGDNSDSTTFADPQRTTGPAPRPIAEFATNRARPRGARFLLDGPPTAIWPMASPMDGTANTFKITFAAEGADFDPALDRTGKWLAYASTQHRATSDIYIKRVDSNAIRQLTDDPANDATPAFSPDGKWVAYASDREGNWDIYLTSINGGPARKISRSPNDEIHPSFSPDGRQLVYCVRGLKSRQWEMAVVDVQNPVTPQFIGYGLFPSWSSTANVIAYQRAREQGSRYFGIWTIEFNNGDWVRPTQITASANAAAITPRWSPDGKRLVFCTIIRPDSDLQKRAMPVQSDIWVINADGTGRANLTRSRFANLQPAWAPDGTVYFVSNRGRGGRENIWAVRTEAAMQVMQTVAAPVSETTTADAAAQGP